MTSAVRVLRKAQADLLDIRRYLDAESSDLGDATVRDLLSAMERLGRFPESGPVARDTRLHRAGYRYRIAGAYLIFYRLVGSHVRVYRVLHQRRAYDRVLG
jgi:plasmid stabilization system protein ParE